MDPEEGILDEFRLGPFSRLDIAAGFDVAVYWEMMSFMTPRRSCLLTLADAKANVIPVSWS